MDRWLVVLLIQLGFAAVTQAQEFPVGAHCVAWRTQKTMFLVSKETPVGINCKIQTSLKEEGGQKVLEVSIPIQGFDSKSADRDADVFTLLKGSQQPDLRFRSELLSNERLLSLAKEGGVVQGQLTIGGKANPVAFTIRTASAGETMVFHGAFQGTFSQFEIDPPRVGGGLVAKVDDKLELLFQFQKSELKGWVL